MVDVVSFPNNCSYVVEIKKVEVLVEAIKFNLTMAKSADPLAELNPRISKEKAELLNSLRDVRSIDSLFPTAAYLTLGSWFLLLLLVYGFFPGARWEPARKEEQDMCLIAAVTMFVTIAAIALHHQVRGHGTRPSGVVMAGVLVCCIAMITNLHLAFFPTVVLVDKVTQSRVFVLRWCEWIPTGGLMTFMVSLSTSLYPELIFTSSSASLSPLSDRTE